ncbi:MAG TPA: TlpA disulfide reductase family protein [Chloroflexota bacterium]|nr:TlpA disulfide reductase family protein [Chloroflexota bacterium]
MTSHLLASLGILGAVLLAGYGVRAGVARRSRRLIGATTEEQAALPAILYFTSADCAPCRLRQTPALDMLQRRLGESFLLRTVDIAVDPETARRYRVLSAPTTVVLDRQGVVRAVNTGVTAAEQLARQLAEAVEPATLEHAG